MIELSDTIRAIEEYISPEEPFNRDPSGPTEEGESSERQNHPATTESATESRKTYSFGDFPINVD